MEGKIREQKLEILLLSEQDVIDAGGLDMKHCVKTMEEVFQIYATGDWRMTGPDSRQHGAVILFPDNPPVYSMPKNSPDRRYVAMHGYLGGRFRACGGKFYGSNRENLALGLPRSILTAFLNDTDTGAPLAIMSGNIISTMRTGAMPGVANKFLQASNATSIGVVGAGVISHACLLALIETMPNCKEAWVYDIVEERSQKFAEELTEMTGIPVKVASSMEEMARNSDAISIAASGKHRAYIKNEWLRPGATLLISGGARLDDEFYLDPSTTIAVDCLGMHLHSMDRGRLADGTIGPVSKMYSTYQFFKLEEAGKIERSRMVELADVVTGKVQMRNDDNHHAVFLSGGLSLEDVAWIYEIYQSALRKGIGTKFKFWDKPYWM